MLPWSSPFHGLIHPADINVTRIQEEAWQDDEQDDNDDDKKDNQREDDHTETQSDGQLNKVSSGRQSCLETLVRLCFLAHCYQFKSLSREALSILEQRTKNMCGEISTGPSDERITNITNELKDAIREAWKPGGAEIQVRDSLLQLSMAMSRHLGLQESFLALVDEVPTFAVDFSKATLSFFSSDAADQAKHVFHSAIKPPATSALPLVPAPAPLLFGSPASGRLLRVPTRRQIGASAILAPTSTSGAHVSSGLLLGSSSANGGEVSKAATPSLWAPSSTPYANKPTVLSFATKPTALSFESPSADGEVASRAVGVHQGDEANGDAPGPLGANIAAVRPVVRNEPSSSMQESFQNIASQNPFKFF